VIFSPPPPPPLPPPAPAPPILRCWGEEEEDEEEEKKEAEDVEELKDGSVSMSEPKRSRREALTNFERMEVGTGKAWWLKRKRITLASSRAAASHSKPAGRDTGPLIALPFSFALP
jgi:hypothetical protein